MMDQKQWANAKKILADAMERDPAQREAFVKDACRGDAGLCDAVIEWLSTADGPTGFLDPPLEGVGHHLMASSTGESEIGQLVGPYRLSEVIATGGMGTVFRAVRADEEYETQVAIKLIKPGMGSTEVIRRFRQERQTLAALGHPNIARLLDGGVASDGAPYLVMEYIEGVPIDEFCDTHDISIAGRLELFGLVCSAVQAAHQRLVVHRDLKPNNILVADDGTPKLLDFGIAKLLEPNSGETADPTVTAFRLMTPQYASPEQIRGEAVTTASDVYALGVILYELLAGHRPYEIKETHRAEAERIICEVDPDTPSTAVARTREVTLADGTTGTISPEIIGTRRGTKPEKLRRLLQGDLDTIVLTAMHKDPARRYASAERLAADIDRYFRGLPVYARRDTFRYRAGKFLRRNKAATVASTLAVHALIAGTVGTSVGMMRAQTALAQSRKDTERARIEARKAERINEFLQNMLTSANPAKSGMEVTVREVVDAAAVALASELVEEPEVQAVFNNSISEVYFAIGLYEKAKRHAQVSLRLFRSVYDDESLQVATALSVLGGVEDALGDLQKAELLHRESLKLRRRLFGENHLEYAVGLNNLACLLEDTNRYAEAEFLHRKALALRRSLLPDEDIAVLKSLQNLAVTLERKGDYAAAGPLYQESLRVLRRTQRGYSPDLVSAISNVAGYRESTGDFPGAEELYREALELDKQALGEVHPDLATSLNNLAFVLHKQGKLDEAEELYREAMMMRKSALGDRHGLVASSMNNLASILEARGDVSAAERLHRQALAIRKEAFGPNSSNVADSLNNLAALFLRRMEYPEAERTFLGALAAYRVSLGDDHLSVARTLNNLGIVYWREDKPASSERCFRESISISRNAHPGGRELLATTLRQLGETLLEQGRAAEAENPLTESLAMWRKILSDMHWGIKNSESVLGGCLTELGRYREAEQLVIRGYTGLRRQKGEAHGMTLSALRRAISLYESWGKSEQAAEYRAKLPAKRVESQTAAKESAQPASTLKKPPSAADSPGAASDQTDDTEDPGDGNGHRP